ncbi:transcriptional regulator, MarR family [Granulicella mallensis MP5ACTX8]|uniref:Transcriptional regulator, MarR family n=2 Tax=Granulicella mallensis TaxID=940614 RepID=G8NXT4_GRAMM|nr:transcriptional regulator, MarR family [Granulicella mallensis MP5ACTX8]
MKTMQKPEKDRKSDGVHLWLVLMKAFQSISAYAMHTLRDSGLGDSDFRVLEALLHKGPLPVNVLGPKVFLTPGSISVAVDRLHSRGLVTRIESESDRRVRIVDLTPKGRTLIQQVFAAHTREIDALMQVLDPEDRRKMTKALKKIGKHAAERLQPPTP